LLKKPEFHRRQIPLFVLLALVLAVWVYTLVDGYLMRRGLETNTVEEVAEVVGGYNTEAGVETVQVVSANREYVLFGPATGSIKMFFKIAGESGDSTYSGIEVQFVQEAGQWVMTDSGVLDGEDLSQAHAMFGDPA